MAWTSTQQSIAIVGLGVRCAVGLSAAAAAAAVRAGISRLREHPYLIDKTGQPMIVAREPSVAPEEQSAERFVALARPAMQEAMATLRQSHLQLPSLPVVVGIPEPRPGLPAGIERALARVAEELALSPDGAAITTLARGNAAGLMAMETACQMLRHGRASLCLAGGVDSYLFATSLEWMDDVGILKSEVNRNGFPPGEAAGFCLLAAPSAVERWQLPVLGWLVSVSSAWEECRIRSKGICVGRGLSDAVAGATKMLRQPEELIDETICDLNGEPYRSEEFAFTVLRTQMAFVDFTRFITPADCWGDVGAASGPLFASLAVAAGRRGYAKGPRALLWASSEGGDRAAAVVQLPLLSGEVRS